MAARAIGAIQITGGSTGQALTSTAALLANWLSNINYQDAGVEILPDYVNNRVIVSGYGLGPVPGSGNPPTQKMRYNVHGVVEGTTLTQADITLQLRKNGVVVPGQIQVSNWNTGIKNQTGFDFAVEISSTDVPGTLALMPTSSPAAPESTNPSGTFTGSTGAPLVGCALDLVASSSTGATITVINAMMIVERWAQ